MGRFLTSSKLTLLLLARIYIQGSIPLSSYKPVLNFIIRIVLQDLHLPGRDTNDLTATVAISHFESVLAEHTSTVPGRTVWDVLLQELWAIDCLNALEDFITGMTALLAKSRDQLILERDTGELSDLPSGNIVHTSLLGKFIRRSYLEYTRLQFHDNVAIWQDLVDYRMSTRAAYERKNDPIGCNILDINLSNLNIDSSHPLSLVMFGGSADQHPPSSFSPQDTEKLLEFQVSEMQSLGGRLPGPMRAKLYEMSLAGATLPKLAHYLKFLDSWRAGDFASAFDNLHRHFDYTMQARDRTYYQYALLNLAVLQADFGCHSEAIPAIQEAIATARENKDSTCLNFCMSWLFHFGRAFPQQTEGLRKKGILGREIEGLQFLKSRAKDAEMWNLLSNSLLIEAKLGLRRGDSISLIFENIVKASQVNITKFVPSLAGSVLLMKASIYSRIGQSRMASACGHLFLDCHTKEAPLDDILKCSCRLANLLTQRGCYSEADDMMASVPKDILRVLKYQNYWTFHNNIFKLRRLLHRGDFDTCLLLLQRLQGQGAPDVEFRSTLALLEIDYYTRKQEFHMALSLVEKLADSAKIENDDIMIQARLLILKAGLLAQSGSPLKGFSITMRAASLAYSARLMPVLWESMAVLATILLAVQEYNATQSLLESILPSVLEYQDCTLAGRIYSLLADTFMSLAAVEVDKREQFVATAMEHLQQAVEQYKLVEDLAGQLNCEEKRALISQ